MIMALFTNVYIYTLIHAVSPTKLFRQVLALPSENQEEFLRLIRNHFKD